MNVQTTPEPVEPSQSDQKHVYNASKSMLTLNKYGKMSLSENPHISLARKTMSKSKPVLELGCAYGYMAKLLLHDGFTVIANDLDQRHLNELVESVDGEEERSRLILRPGNLLDLKLENDSLSGVICCNVIHFLEGHQIRDLFHRCYKWLAPNGILTFSAASPYSMRYFLNREIADELIKTFYKDLQDKVEWPGQYDTKKILTASSNEISNVLFKNVPDKSNLVSAEILVREALLAGFRILKVDYFDENENGYYEPIEISKMEIASILCIK
jgi:SAM-dependent methyltransferase